MLGLDLFSGIGGITLALEPWVRPVAYCEIERYCQGVLMSRMASGELPKAPIWDDVRTLSGAQFAGVVDIIYGGFPCQNLSCAGRREGLAGDRSSLFFEIMRLAEEIKPRFLFFENVPAIRTSGLAWVGRELASLRYDCRWGTLSAYDVGAPHLRNRWFLLGYANGNRKSNEPFDAKVAELQGAATDAIGKRIRNKSRRVCGKDGEGQAVAIDYGTAMDTCNADFARLEIGEPRDAREQPSPFRTDWWESEPDVGGTAYGIPGKLDGGLYGIYDEEAERSAEEILCDLRDGIISSALERSIRGLDCISATDALFSIMREYEDGYRLPRKFVESEASLKNIVREMRRNGSSDRSPLRRGSLEQYFREHPNALRIMSRLVASRGETPWACSLWEGSVPRTVNRLPMRIDRISSLGNSVCPPQVREAFRRLMGLEATCD